MELIDRKFYQLSCDDAMVAITADYLGLLPTSHVRKDRSPDFQKGSPFTHFTYRTHMVFYREGLRDAMPNPQRLANKGRRSRVCQKGRRSGLRRRRRGMIQNLALWLSSFLKRNDVHVSLTEKTLTGMCPVRLPIMLPPVGLQDRT